MDSTSAILDGLNDKQREVATFVDGKAIVLAGAGSGKTHTLTRRIAYLIHLGVPAWQITAVSFTKKASREIKDRVLDVIGSPALDVKIGTFHSLCMRILLSNQQVLYRHGLLNQETMTILTEDDSSAKIKDFCFMFGITDDDSIKACQGKLNYWANNNISPDDLKNSPEENKDYILAYQEYIMYKYNAGYVDYNDMLSLTLKLLKTDEEVLNTWSRRIKYFLVDECQDLNNVQFELMFYLTSHFENYMLIGDDLQSLYKFRGANVNNMIDIKNIEPEIQTLLLERNYRSTQTIVQASNSLVSHNINQLEKVAYSEREKGHPIYAYVSPDETKEADFICEAIQGFVASGQYSYKDFSIIYRAGWLSRQIELALTSLGIPFDVQNGTSFYDRKEVKDIAAYLRIIQNPTDDIALARIVNVPKRGVGEGTLDKIKMYALENELSLYATMRHLNDIKGIRKTTKEAIASLLDTIQECREFIFASPNQSVHYLVNMIIRKTNFLDQFDPSKVEDETRIDNLAEISKIALSFDVELQRQMDSDDFDKLEYKDSLTRFIAGTALFEVDGDTNSDDDSEDNKVRLTTVHSSKGLEWPIVFVVGLEEGVFPSRRSETEEDIEEERRGMYVAMTRAKDILFVSYNQNRYFSGNVLTEQKPSRFLSELPKSHLKILGWKAGVATNEQSSARTIHTN